MATPSGPDDAPGADAGGAAPDPEERKVGDQMYAAAAAYAGRRNREDAVAHRERESFRLQGAPDTPVPPDVLARWRPALDLLRGVGYELAALSRVVSVCTDLSRESEAARRAAHRAFGELRREVPRLTGADVDPDGPLAAFLPGAFRAAALGAVESAEEAFRVRPWDPKRYARFAEALALFETFFAPPAASGPGVAPAPGPAEPDWFLTNQADLLAALGKSRGHSKYLKQLEESQGLQTRKAVAPLGHFKLEARFTDFALHEEIVKKIVELRSERRRR